ncbi:DUF726-domain-containing protein [Irpex rosettiformis]|uniref:DUF726-domain-containing protein n=1 Tax=Irpex rosettiformis TaxID=378272 RepID=A0ACB8UHA8_9APHY|nr:DUF726-domain-containing protein [Irpex rosettiformis]
MSKDQPQSDLTKVTPPAELTEPELKAVFQHLKRRLAAHRNHAETYAMNELVFTSGDVSKNQQTQEAQCSEINHWAQTLLENAWAACQEPGGGKCPELTSMSDTSTTGLPALPAQAQLNQLLHTILFIDLTSTRSYHAHTRTFLSTFGSLDEDAIAATLKDPQRAVAEAERKSKTDTAKEEQAQRNATMRKIGLGIAAASRGWLGIGGTAAGLLASGLAGSSVVCGALFGAYGSKKSAEMVDRYTKEVEDLAIVPIREPRETLAVKLCVSGWLESPEDVSAPWTVLDGQDTFALQWTVFAALAAALSPTAWLKIGQIIDNPWMTTKVRASKTARVLSTLLASRILGNRPITLIGYSLGSQIIFEALQHLAALPPSQTIGLIQDVYLFGSPVPADEVSWASVRRVVAGRLVNGYSTNDYVLAVLARASGGSWSVSGLQAVQVQGVENVECKEVDGHLHWRGIIGQCLQKCGVEGVVGAEIREQLKKKEEPIETFINIGENDIDEIIKRGDDSKEGVMEELAQERTQ